MKHSLITLSAIMSLAFAKPALADEPKIAVSIAPLAYIVKQVAGDYGTVSQIVPQGQSAHDMSLRPSQRRLVERSDLIFLVHPQLEASLPSLVKDDDARFVILAEHMADSLLPLDESRMHDHDHDGHDDHHDEHDDHDDHHDDHHDEHKHDDHDDHHDEHKHDVHDEHHDEHKHDDHDGHHVLTEMDLHLWMSPSAMALVAGEVAHILAARYPEQQSSFEANSIALQAELATIDDDIKTMLAAVQTGPFITMHHVTAYLEDAYNLSSVGAILPHAEGQISAGHLRALEQKAREQNVACLFYEPEFSQKIATQLAQDLEVKAVLLDPLGSQLGEGADISDYWQQMKQSLEACFTS